MQYKAFISYRHAPADIAVAKEIQQKLEHFHIPAKLQKQTGLRQIGRIFRDQEELPITSDLGVDISNALENAEYLIVICSKATAESVWVRREITQFLKTHDRRRILTVLVNGEPSEVIPDLVVRQTQTVTVDGEEVEEEQLFEPLSCDFRKQGRAERRAELLRLAAGLIGCPYDELVMRERQYKRRRILTAASAAGVLLSVAIGYLIWSNAQIRTNYERAEENYQLAEENYQLAEENYAEAQSNYQQALYNQAQYLANASLDALESGDRELAIQLALAALPQEGEDRAVPATVEYALSKASGAYAYWSGSLYDYEQLRNYRIPGNIHAYTLSPAGDLLFVSYGNSRLCAWDLVQDQQLYDISLPDTVYCMKCDDSDRLYLQNNPEELYGNYLWLNVLDARTGMQLWSSGGYTFYHDADQSWITESSAFLVADQEVYKATFREREIIGVDELQVTLQFMRLDAADGAVLQESPELSLANKSHVAMQMLRSDDGARLAVVARVDDLQTLYLYDLTQEKLVFSQTLPEEFSFEALQFSEDGKTIYACVSFEVLWDTWVSIGRTGKTESMLRDTTKTLVALDAESGETLWTFPLETSQINFLDFSHILFNRELPAEDGTVRPVVGCILGNTLWLCDGQTGEQLRMYAFRSEIVDYVYQTGKKGLRMFLRDGETVGLRTDNNYASAIYLFSTSITDMDYSLDDGTVRYFLVQTEDRKLSLYEPLLDESVQRIDSELSESEYWAKVWQGEDYLCVIDSRDYLLLYDLDGGTLRAKSTLPDGYYNYAFCGTDPSGERLFLQYDTISEKNLVCVSLKDGTIQQTDFTELEDCRNILCNGSWPYAALPEGSNQIKLCRIEVDAAGVAHAGESIVLPALLRYRTYDYVASEGGIIFLAKSTTEEYPNSIYCYGPDCELLFALEDCFLDEPSDAALSADRSLLAFCEGATLSVYGQDGTLRYARTSPNANVACLQFLELEGQSLLLTVDLDGVLTVLRAADGTQLYSVALSIGEDTPSHLWCESRDGLLYVLPMSSGEGILTVLDLETWLPRTEIRRCGGFDAERNLAFIWQIDGMVVFRRHSVAELREMARALLNGREMSEETKAIYGLTSAS